MSQESDFRRNELLHSLYHCAIVLRNTKSKSRNAVMQICGIQYATEMKHLEGSIHGGQVKDLITKFFYRDNFLCFQILLQMTGGEVVLFRELTDYTEYKRIFSDLQRAKNSDALIDIPKNNFKNMPATLKVA